MSIYQKARCCECSKLYWTTKMTEIYTCEKCSTPRCPICKEVNIVYIVANTKECNITKFLRCLSQNCGYRGNNGKEKSMEVVDDEVTIISD